MNFQLFFAVSAVVILSAFASALTAWAIGYAYSQVRQNRYGKYIAAKERAKLEIGAEISDLSHWFGESKPVSLALSCLGHAMTSGRGIDANYIREEWRRTQPKPVDEDAGLNNIIEIVAQWLAAWNKPRTNNPADNIQFHSLSETSQDIYRQEARALLNALPKPKK
jgi:hypothetical protein